MSYQLSDQAHPLHYLRLNVEAYTASAHETMKAEARIEVERHNAAIDLLTGWDKYAEYWEAPTLDDSGRPVLRDNAAGQFQVALDSLCIELRARQTPWMLADRELIERDIAAIAAVDAEHPVARHADVLRLRCLPAGVSLDGGA